MRESPYPLEQALGISFYGTPTEGIGGRLRSEPGDFTVEEVPEGPWGDSGPYLVLRLTKENWEQQRLVKEMARILGISHRRISWAGTKDRRAVTSQYIFVYGLDPGQVEKISLPGVHIEVAGRAGHPLSLGALRGNRFTIRIRECDPQGLTGRVAEVARAAGDGFPNYVGIQRFGVIRPVTHLVGEKMLRGDFDGAALTYLAASFPSEPAGVREAREGFGKNRDVKEALRNFPVRLTFERAMLHHLDRFSGDYGGALKSLPPRLLSMFVSAFQSFLFNTLLSDRCRQGIPMGEPAPGDRLLFSDGREDRVTGVNLDAAALQVRREGHGSGSSSPGPDLREIREKTAIPHGPSSRSAEFRRRTSPLPRGSWEPPTPA